MDISEIEQLSFAELKTDRSARTEDAKKVPIDVLASHFIRTLTTAKQRDEKLGEQGRTITLLQEGADAAKARIVAMDAELTACQQTLQTERQAALENNATRQTAFVEAEQTYKDEISVLQESARQVSAADKITSGKVIESLAQQTARADRLKAHAGIAKTAVVQAAATLNLAVAAMQTETADQGE